jgi:hypothetical protein
VSQVAPNVNVKRKTMDAAAMPYRPAAAVSFAMSASRPRRVNAPQRNMEMPCITEPQ